MVDRYQISPARAALLAQRDELLIEIEAERLKVEAAKEAQGDTSAAFFDAQSKHLVIVRQLADIHNKLAA